MAVNKYGIDWENNIWWNKEYPFIPEATTDTGLTIHEGDIVDFEWESCRKIKYMLAARVYKIYDKDHMWVRYYDPDDKSMVTLKWKTTRFVAHDPKNKPPKDEIFEFVNQDFANHFEWFLSSVYGDLYPEELSLPDDWHFDDDKYEAKRLEEVERVKKMYQK